MDKPVAWIPKWTGRCRRVAFDRWRKIRTGTVLDVSFRTLWVFINVQLMEMLTPSGTCTRTSIRRCCDRPQFASSWLAMKCLAPNRRDITAENAAARLREVRRVAA